MLRQLYTQGNENEDLHISKKMPNFATLKEKRPNLGY